MNKSIKNIIAYWPHFCNKFSKRTDVTQCLGNIHVVFVCYLYVLFAPENKGGNFFKSIYKGRKMQYGLHGHFQT